MVSPRGTVCLRLISTGKRPPQLVIKTKSKIIFTQPVYKRAVEAKRLFETACKLKISDLNKLYVESNVKIAVKLAGESAGRNGNVLIIGSFFLVSEAIKSLKIQPLFK